ncbi:hypothetical protein TUM3794_06890 [Shewanella colwelliana]|uniref:RHS repeat-associated core domain-containing protein n=1 Tax=Shewanella colwelliana TaxID=23 RepID=A0ABQ4NVM7_SHECO|nr:RHS repeat-associated core domain-containing protein [Shewanella colwelliana]GIU36959.1 hypothetical protein TUM3794_06890 [Shewanella colwelliana]
MIRYTIIKTPKIPGYGAVLQHRGYDVFGRPRDIAAGNNLLASWQGVTKGYTDHEHLNEQQLIHMNGRIYDFNVGRFLSVDPFLQFPENSQSANPYSYILNNPMSGTDPTGYSASAVGDNHQEEMTNINQGEAVVANNKATNGEENVNRAVRDNRSANKVGTFSGSRASTFGGSGNNGSAKSGTSVSQISVTGSAEESTSAKLSVPGNDVLGTKEMDSQATEIINNFESGGTKEQAILVDKSGKHIEPESCNNRGCSFDSPKNVRFVAHLHVESNHPHSGMAEATTEKREMPGPGDHSFLVKKNAPNYFRTPSGVIKVLEYKGGQYQVRTLSTGSISPNWNPSDAKLSRRETKKALKR